MRTCRGGHVGVFFLLVLSSSSTQCERMSRLFSPVLLRCRLPCGRLLLRYYRFTATSETRGRIHEKVPSIDDRQSDCRFFLMEPRNHDSHPTPSLPAAPPPPPPPPLDQTWTSHFSFTTKHRDADRCLWTSRRQQEAGVSQFFFFFFFNSLGSHISLGRLPGDCSPQQSL